MPRSSCRPRLSLRIEEGERYRAVEDKILLLAPGAACLAGYWLLVLSLSKDWLLNSEIGMTDAL